jgi:hypothetical protein
MPSIQSPFEWKDDILVNLLSQACFDLTRLLLTKASSPQPTQLADDLYYKSLSSL